MSEQLKQELEADTDRLETGTVAGSETIGEQEEKPTEGKLEAQEGDESKEEDTVPMGKASLADVVSGIPAPTKEEVEAAEAENAKPVQQKAREKLEAEKKKATQKNFADPVITYLMKRCEEDQGLAEDVMQEGKTWNKCFSYIVEQARKQSNGRSAAVEDQVVYEWAEDYYHKDDKAEEEKKAEAKEKTKKQMKKLDERADKARKTSEKMPTTKKPKEKAGESKPETKSKKNNKDMDGQLDMFSFFGM